MFDIKRLVQVLSRGEDLNITSIAYYLRSMKDHFLRIAASLLFLFLVSCDGLQKEPEILKPVGLAYVDKSFINEKFEVDDFSIQWQGLDKETLQLVVYHKNVKRKWRTKKGKTFVSAALADFEATEFAGFFHVVENVAAQCAQQSLKRWEKLEKSLLVHGTLKCGGELVPYSLTFKSESQYQLNIVLNVDHDAVGRTGLYFIADKEEQFFGLGEQFSDFNFKGKRVPILVSEQGLSRGKEPFTSILNLFAKGAGGYWFNSYAPIPHFISSQLRSLALGNTEYSIFDFRSPIRIHVQTYSARLDAQLFFSDTPLGIVSEYTEFSGKMRALPEWIGSGAIIGLQGGSEKVKSIVQKINDLGGVLAAVWIQDWQGQRETLFGKRLWWNWELDEAHYSDFEGLKQSLSENDIKLMAYINPFLVDAKQKGKYKRNLYEEANQNNYLLDDLNGEPVFISQGSFKAYLVDFSNQEARRWYKEVIQQEILDQGFSGWMADFGEAMPFDTLPNSGESAFSLHNQYPVEWAKINRKAIEEHSEKSARETVFFMRSAFTKSPAYSTLFWLGDQATNWDNFDGIKTSVTALLTSGLSGFAFNHGDVGGYFSSKLPFTPHRSEELLMRWIELGAFQSVFRTHEGLLPDDNKQVFSDEKLLKHFSRFTQIYAAWSFYRKQLINEATENGWPVLRHPFLHYPEEERYWSISYQQFLIGEALWFAPVLDEGQTSVEIYLPKGEWVHAFTGKRYVSDGPEKAMMIPSPIGTPAIVYQRGSIVGQQFRENLSNQGLI